MVLTASWIKGTAVKRTAASFLLAASLLSLAPRVAAQGTASTLSGTVVDESGAVVPGVTIAVHNVPTGLRRETVTTSQGFFTFPLLPPGPYVLTGALDGFAPIEVPDIVLHVGDSISLQVRLKVARVGAEVTVVAAPTRVSTSPAVGTVVDRKFVENLPLNGRSLQSLLQLVPGVVLATNQGTATGGSQFSVNGQRTTANYFMVDGVSANAGVATGAANFALHAGSGQTPAMTALGSTNSLVSIDALQEFRIETSTFAPEFGRTPGGQISLVTRSGTNAFHGSASEYFRHHSMDANDWFGRSRNLPKPNERQHMFSAVVGGPVLRDRFFFFSSYEGLRLKEPRVTVASVPTLALRAAAHPALAPFLAAFPLPNGRDLGGGLAEFAASYSDSSSFDIASLRLDYRLTNALNTFMRINHAPSESSARFGVLSLINRTGVETDSVTVGTTWAGKSRLTADLRANWTHNAGRFAQDLDTLGGAVVPRAADIFLPGRDPSSARFGFGAAGTSWGWGIGTTDVQRQINVVGSLAWVASSHQVKLGLDYRRMTPLLGASGQFAENLTFPTAAAVISGVASAYSITNGDPVPREPRFSNFSIYAQDTWRLHSRLTLTYGLRFEHVPPPTEASGRHARTLLGIEGDVLDNPRLAPAGTPLWRGRAGEFAPRIGAAYQASSREGWETTLRGGVGVFYDLGLGFMANPFQNMFPFFASVPINNQQFPFAAQQRVPPRLGIDPASQFQASDPDLRLPYTRQWNVAWEQALGPAQTMTIGYVGAAGRRLLLYPLYNQPMAEWPGVPINISVSRNIGRSEYHALQVQVQRRLRRGVQALASYTLGRAQDTGSQDNAVAPPASRSELLEQQWGPSDHDVRHVLSVAVTADIPGLRRSGLLRALSSNWGVDALLRAQSGAPLNIVVGNERIDQVLYPRRPDLVAGQSLYVDDPAAPGGRLINRAAFATPGVGVPQGTFPRNGLRGFRASQIDLTLRRQFGLTNGVRLQLRAEVFNLFNRANFGPPNTALTNALFGQPTQMMNRSLGGLSSLYQMGGPRSGQLAVKVLF